MVWDVQNTSTTPTDTGYKVDTDDPMTDDINVVANSIVVGMACNSSSGATHAWTGVTEEFDEVIEGTQIWTAGSAFVATADSSYTVTCDQSGTAEPSFCCASFPPA